MLRHSFLPPATQLITFSEYQWSRDKVLALISSVEEYFDDFYDKSLKKKYIWSNVANHMSEKGYTCTGLACDKKWRDLKVGRPVVTHIK